MLVDNDFIFNSFAPLAEETGRISLWEVKITRGRGDDEEGFGGTP